VQPLPDGLDSLGLGVAFGRDWVDDKDLGSSGLGVAFGRDWVDHRKMSLPNAAPLREWVDD
jgi:hypothetical protein